MVTELEHQKNLGGLGLNVHSMSSQEPPVKMFCEGPSAIAQKYALIIFSIIGLYQRIDTFYMNSGYFLS